MNDREVACSNPVVDRGAVGGDAPAGYDMSEELIAFLRSRVASGFYLSGAVTDALARRLRATVYFSVDYERPSIR